MNGLIFVYARKKQILRDFSSWKSFKDISSCTNIEILLLFRRFAFRKPICLYRYVRVTFDRGRL